MKGSKWWLLACVPLALAACGANDTDAEEDDPTDGAAAATVPPPAGTDTGAAASGMAPMMVPLRPVGNSGVNGQVTVTDGGTQTQLALTLTGLQPNGAHAGHVHQGTCDSLGSAVAPLPVVTADASGTGSATETVAIPTATLMDGRHVVAYHEAGGSPGAPVVCGAVPGHAM